jgi:signal transduction histidine kinase
MTSDVVARVFEPFFSTRLTGRGLGLPAALGVVRGHRGAITIDSTPGVGTRVTVWLPHEGDR